MEGNDTLDDEILLQHGGAEINKLTDIVGLVPDEDEENDINVINHSNYCVADKLPTFLGQDHGGLKILSLNAQSLNAKFAELQIFIDLWQSQNICFDIICIQETWLKRDIDVSLLQLPGYNLINQMKSCSRHGGLIIYVNDDLNCSVFKRVETSPVWEGLFIEVTGGNMKKGVIIGNIYKPPKSNSDENLQQFIDHMEETLIELNRHNREVVIAGDFNINLLKLHERSKYAEFLDTMVSNSYFPKITLPTRLSKSSATLIDNFYCKLSKSGLNTQSGIIYTNLSDHYPYFTCLDDGTNKEPSHPKYIHVRKNTEASRQSFKSALAQTDFHTLLNQDLRSNPDDNYNKFHERLMNLKAECMPGKTIKFHKHKHKKSKWITNGILNSIKFRDSMYKELQQTPRESDRYTTLKTNLSTYNKIIKKNIREAKMLYYTESFDKQKHDIKKDLEIDLRNYL